MKPTFTRRMMKYSFILLFIISSLLFISSSHREAPLIANDPLADNTDLYAFRSPVNSNKVIIIANFIPFQLPHGGPNFYQFGENVRYEIHIDNDVATPGDDITYRFTFFKKNEDPSTFFNIRLGKENLKTTYIVERSKDGGAFTTILRDGEVPPPNVGPRSISSGVGLNEPDYNNLITKAIKTAKTGEKIFAGTADDPFYVDLGGIFDLGDAPRQGPTHSEDGLKCKNVSTIALEIDISTLQKDGKSVQQADNILDPNFVIGVWASASRQKIRVLNTLTNTTYENNTPESHMGPWVQVSRLGMPLTNEAVIPIGLKDLWNRITPYQDLAYFKTFARYFWNPELSLYMDDDKFGGAVPAFSALRIQKKSLGQFGFGFGQNGLYDLKGNAAITGTALSRSQFGSLLLPQPNSPRSVDLWPIFHTGVPNFRPYQLAVGKGGNPLAEGKPFIHNFLPNGGDMLRLNMAVPVTQRNDPDFSPLGLVQAAVLGLTDPRFNANKDLQNIPNMDGFPNGRRLEDDVTRIELQAVGGIVLAAIGLWYDDFIPGTSPSPVTQDLLDVLTYNTGINRNDVPFKTEFPYVQAPFPGTYNCDCDETDQQAAGMNKKLGAVNELSVAPVSKLGISTPDIFATATPNPVINKNTVRYKVDMASKIRIVVFDELGKAVKVVVDKTQEPGTYSVDWNTTGLSKGVYFVSISKNGVVKQTIRLVK